MIDKLAGLPTQIRQLEKRLKEMDASKVKPALVKEITDTIQNLKNLLKEKMDKREERRKSKEQAASEVQKEAISVPNAADVGAVSQNSPTPAAAPGAAAATPTTSPDVQQSCPLCGGLQFPDAAAYQQHMQYTHASDIMPTSPGQKEDKLVASTDPVIDKVEKDPKLAPGIIVPDSVKKHDEVVDRVEKDPKVAPHIISEKEEPKFKLDDVVKPVRGSESTGKVMRWDGKPSDLVYVAWDSGPLADRDTFGGYYPHDLELLQEEPVEVEATPQSQEKPVCADCVSMKEKHGDLKGNYEALLKDLKEERDIHYTQGNQKWVERLDQKIRDLEKSMDEKFSPEKESCTACGQKKESGAQNAEDLTIMDHTPPRANSGPDAGGKDSHDEFQDEWAMPAGIEMESAQGAPNSLFDAKTAPHVAEQLNEFINAPYVDANVSTLGGPDRASVLVTISADPKEKWVNGILQNSRYGNFHIYNDGTVEQFSGAFAGWKQPNRAFRKSRVKNVEQLVAVINDFLAKVNSTPTAAPKTSALSAPITQPTKLSVFNKEFVATPVNDQKKFGGYEISQNGKKLFKINSKNSQPMTKEQLEFCAQIELTKGLKQAKLTEKIAFLAAGTNVYILAQDKAGKRIKFASMEQGLRGWAPVSKFAFIAKEGEMRKHKDHIDNTFGHNGKEILVDCPNGSGNMVWLPMGELLPIQQPPATPESLNDLESAKECPDCHGTYEGKEGETCPTCGRFAVQKEALKPALPPQILNRRMEVNATVEDWVCETCHENISDNQRARAHEEKGHKVREIQSSLDKKAAGCDQCNAAMINGVFCHETGCPNSRKQHDEEDMDVEGSSVKQAEGENGYICFYKGKKFEVYAKTSYEAQQKCAREHGIKKSHEITVMLAEKGDAPGVPVVHDPSILGSLKKKATVTHREDGWHVLSEKGKNLGGPYKTKGEAVKRLREVEYFKHHGAIRPFSRKVIAEVMSDPYQSLTDHITDMKSRMNQVQDRLQTTPVVKAAAEDGSSAEMDLPALFADLTQGVELLETKLGGDDIEPELHKGVEELENKLWQLEEKLGLTPKLSEHEKAEPEHKEIVKDLDKEADMVTDETIEETTNNPNAINPSLTTIPPTTPTIQNVQPTDDDNLEVPVAAPTSPASPGQKWVFDTQFNKYVSMPDPAYRG